MRGRRSATGALLAVALATGLGACGDGDDDARSSSDVPDDAVAVVGDAKISEDTFDARVEALRRAQPQTAKQRRALENPEQRRQNERQLKTQALSLLLMGETLEQEAADRGVEVPLAEARQRWESVASRQFRTERALRRFLAGQTERDVVEQLRLQMLAEEIYAQVAEQAGGGKRGQRAVKRFQREFRKRWQSETACREGLDAAGCPAQSK